MTDLTVRLASLIREIGQQLSEGAEPASPVRIEVLVGREGGATVNQSLNTEMLKPALVREARKILQRRTARTSYFPAELFGEPSWNILLDLYINKSRGVRVSITSACIASGAAHSTGLRYIEMMIEMNLINKSQSEVDGRVSYVELSEKAERSMDDYLRTLLT